jgi:hypothetical protein
MSDEGVITYSKKNKNLTVFDFRKDAFIAL